MADKIIYRGQGQLGFWYDHSKPRREEGRPEAVKRYLAISGAKGHNASKNLHCHHVDCDRSNGHPANLFVCKDESQHSNLHAQLQAMTSFLIKGGLVKFDWAGKFYYVADKYLKEKFESLMKPAMALAD